MVILAAKLSQDRGDNHKCIKLILLLIALPCFTLDPYNNCKWCQVNALFHNFFVPKFSIFDEMQF